MSDVEKVFIAGHGGLVGSALLRRLGNVPGLKVVTRNRAELDLTNQLAVNEFFVSQRPTHVYLAAGRVGGILDNADHPGEFIRENLLIAINVIDAAYRSGVHKLLYFGSSCIYPSRAPQPIRPEYLLSGPLEQTNRAYSVAKIAGIEICRAYREQYGFNAIAVMPSNLYGPNDNFDPERSHVLPALLQRFASAAERGDTEVSVWGTGTPRREFLYADDLAEAAELLMARYESSEIINIGYGEDVSIADVAALVAEVTGFNGRICFDPTKPDGTSRKLLDVSVVRALGWRPRTTLREGLLKTWQWYCSLRASSSGRQY